MLSTYHQVPILNNPMTNGVLQINTIGLVIIIYNLLENDLVYYISTSSQVSMATTRHHDYYVSNRSSDSVKPYDITHN